MELCQFVEEELATSVGQTHKLKKVCKFLQCEVDLCVSRRTYGLAGKAQFCKEHRTEGMRTRTHLGSKCVEAGCEKGSSYGFRSENKGTIKKQFCTIHKKEGMQRYARAECVYPGCKTCPSFKVPGGPNRYCGIHRKEGMVGNNQAECEQDGCTLQPHCGFEDGKKRFCQKHAQPGMQSKQVQCDKPGCHTQPRYAKQGERAHMCRVHKSDDMIEVATRRCKTYLCDIMVNKNNNGYCVRCFSYLFPKIYAEGIRRNYKTKEICVADFVKASFPEQDWACDKTVDWGCSRKRPDLLLNLGSHVLIVEVDENQHSTYDNLCEQQRIMTLYQDVGHAPTVFIRFNPDGYMDAGLKRNSCWGANSYGIMMVKKSYETEWAARLERLRATIAAHMALVPERAITQVPLFFDVIDETGELGCVRLAAKYATKLDDTELLDRLLCEAKENLSKQLTLERFGDFFVKVVHLRRVGEYQKNGVVQGAAALHTFSTEVDF